ncbi:MAG TPA: ATP-binding protein, partial [Polyangium sp.]|nr:ATP-binding protein [Polyangium sp.]
MLIQFLVENFLSFKDETVFSLLAPPEETRGVIEVPTHGLRLMRIAAFYGANASGKSNFTKALEAARELIVHEQLPHAELPARSFRLDQTASTKPTRFQFDILIQDICYTYVLVFTRSMIVAEALYRKLPNTANDEIVYEREAPADKGEHLVKFGPMIDARSDKDRLFAEFTARGAHFRQPLLTKFAIGNVSGFDAVYSWFLDGVTIIGASARYANLIQELNDNPSLRTFFSEKLTNVGTGIRDVQIEERPYELASLGHDNELLESFIRDAVRQLEKSRNEKFITRSEESGGTVIDAERKLYFKLKLIHRSGTGFEASFDLEDESDGTQRLLHLLPVLFHRTQESGLCTVIDELDRSLHTMLTRYFVEEFLSVGSDTQTQLIFTTHDTNLLNGRLLPARAVWFVEKDDNGASRIHSLSEYKPEQLEYLLEHLEEGYLQGRFGAIPFI